MPMKNPPHPGKVVLEECIKPRLVNGRNGISPLMAVRLSMAFGGSTESWLRQQMNYDLAQVQKAAKDIHISRFEPASEYGN